MTSDTQKIAKLMIWITWFIVLGFLFIFFDKIIDHQINPNQRVDSAINESGVIEVKLQRNRAGHYVANGFINGQDVTFLVDTGASDVAIPMHLAEKLGLQKGQQIRYHTANGTTFGYSTHLNQVQLGEISLNNIRGGITPNMPGEKILLGMSFLKKLEFTQRGDSLTIRQFPENF